MSVQGDRRTRAGRRGRRLEKQVDRRGHIGVSERLLLAVVSLIFVGVFAVTYLYTESNRPSASLAAFGKAWPSSVENRDTPQEAPRDPATADARISPPALRPVITGASPNFTICHTGGRHQLRG